MLDYPKVLYGILPEMEKNKNLSDTPYQFIFLDIDNMVVI